MTSSLPMILCCPGVQELSPSKEIDRFARTHLHTRTHASDEDRDSSKYASAHILGEGEREIHKPYRHKHTGRQMDSHIHAA